MQRDYKISVITQNLEGYFGKTATSSYANQIINFGKFLSENLLGTENDLVFFNGQESYEVTSGGIFKQLFTPDTVFFQKISTFVLDLNDQVLQFNIKCFFDSNFTVAALFQIYCAKRDLQLGEAFPIEQIKFSESGGLYLPFSLAGFKGGLCSLYQLEEFSILNVNMHISSKNLND